MTISEVSVAELADDAVLLDVREPDEFAAGHAVGAVNIPLDLLPVLLHDLPTTDGPLPVICKSVATGSSTWPVAPPPGPRRTSRWTAHRANPSSPDPPHRWSSLSRPSEAAGTSIR